jgi:hypothetical protein
MRAGVQLGDKRHETRRAAPLYPRSRCSEHQFGVAVFFLFPFFLLRDQVGGRRDGAREGGGGGGVCVSE